MATTISENKKLVRRVEQAVNNRDSDAIADIFADDFVFHGELEEHHGVDEFNDYLQGLFNAFPDITLTFEQLVAEDDIVVVRYTGVGTHEGEYNGVHPTDQKVNISGMRMVRVDDGAIVEVWAQTNNLGLLGQLGVVEPPAG